MDDIKEIAQTVEKTKNHPVLKVAGALLTFVTIIITGFLAVDERYAHAGDIKELQQSQQTQMMYLRDENERALLLMRKKTIEDKVFELNIKDRQSSVDKALVKRYEAEAKSIDERVLNLEMVNRSRGIVTDVPRTMPASPVMQPAPPAKTRNE